MLLNQRANKMDRAKAIQVFAYTLFTLIVLLFPPAMCGEVEDEEAEFNYNLSSKNGPLNWGNIRPEWYLCKNGTRQSPINLQENRADLVFNSGIQRSYRPANANLRSTDHDIMVNWTENAGYISINGTQYQLDQCHWHSPSEHTINDKRYDLELHMVHRSSDEKYAVTGFLYKIGEQDPFISTIEDDLRLMAANQTRETPLGTVGPEQVVGMVGKKYFRYNGSFTAPPCDENVIWTVFTNEVKTVAREQIKLLRAAVNGDGDESYVNARPLQPRNGRPVQLYVPKNRQGN